MWNDLLHTVFDTETLDGFKGAVICWLLPRVVFTSVFCGTGASGVVKAIYEQFFSPFGPLLRILIIII